VRGELDPIRDEPSHLPTTDDEEEKELEGRDPDGDVGSGSPGANERVGSSEWVVHGRRFRPCEGYSFCTQSQVARRPSSRSTMAVNPRSLAARVGSRKLR
jgi:hypothetical protein